MDLIEPIDYSERKARREHLEVRISRLGLKLQASTSVRERRMYAKQLRDARREVDTIDRALGDE